MTDQKRAERNSVSWTLSIRQPIFDDMMANEQTSLSRVADREKFPLLLDKARQFAGQYIDSLEERPMYCPAKNRCERCMP